MEVFGKYRLSRRLAVGGMAEVFLASSHDAPGKQVVIKRLLPHLEADEEFVVMFSDEARLGLQLSHPNLVDIHDYGSINDTHYIAMEFVDGVTLSDLLKQMPGHRLPLGLSCWIIGQAAAGMAYAHALTDAQGKHLRIVHRDISPDNILLSRKGTVKVADFGVAKNASQSSQTRPGQLKGKVAYSSPEQALVSQVDHRSDIFSLGVVLYEMTVGRRVFPSENNAVILRSLLDEEYTPPQEIVPTYPPALAEVVNRALRWDLNERLADASELYHQLQALIPLNSAPTALLAELVKRCADNLAQRKKGRRPVRSLIYEEEELPATVMSAVPEIDAPVPPQMPKVLANTWRALDTLDPAGQEMASLQATITGETANLMPSAQGSEPSGELAEMATRAVDMSEAAAAESSVSDRRKNQPKFAGGTLPLFGDEKDIAAAAEAAAAEAEAAEALVADALATTDVNEAAADLEATAVVSPEARPKPNTDTIEDPLLPEQREGAITSPELLDGNLGHEDIFRSLQQGSASGDNFDGFGSVGGPLDQPRATAPTDDSSFTESSFEDSASESNFEDDDSAGFDDMTASSFSDNTIPEDIPSQLRQTTDPNFPPQDKRPQATSSLTLVDRPIVVPTDELPTQDPFPAPEEPALDQDPPSRWVLKIALLALCLGAAVAVGYFWL